MTTTFLIEFEDPTRRLQGEGCSKKLKVDSDLVRYLSDLRRKIQARVTVPVKGDDRPWHIEVTKRSDRDQLVQRAQGLHGQRVDVANITTMHGKALVLKTPSVPGYGPTHITIAFFPNGVPPNTI